MHSLPQGHSPSRPSRLVPEKENDGVPEPIGQDTAKMGKAVLLESIYFGSNAGALRGPQALYQRAKELGHSQITLKNCQDFLKGQATYTRFRPALKTYPRNTIVANSCGEILQVDIMDMQRVKEENDGYLYALVSYDTFSKYLSAVPMRNRKPESVLEALGNMLEALPFPIQAIYWDKVCICLLFYYVYQTLLQEGAFVSRKMQAWLKEKSIHNYTTTSSVKAPSVERAIRTIRTALAKYWQLSHTFRWIDYLPVFVSRYNNRVHSTTKLRPLDLAVDPMLVVSTNRNPSLFPKKALPPVGSLVRLNVNRGVFEKESRGTWTTEVFRVVKHKVTTPIPMVYIEDLMGEPIKGGFYPEEVQQVEWDGTREIDQVLKRRKRKGNVQLLVSYKGWPLKFNEWVSENV